MNKQKPDDDFEAHSEKLPPETPYQRDYRAHFRFSQPGVKLFWIKSFLVTFVLCVTITLSIRPYIGNNNNTDDDGTEHVNTETHVVRWAIGLGLIYTSVIATLLFVLIYLAVKHYWNAILVYGGLILMAVSVFSFVMYVIGALVY